MDDKFNEFADGVINSYDELKNQMESLKEESKIMMTQGEEIFKRDFHAIKIAIQICDKYMEEHRNGKERKNR